MGFCVASLACLSEGTDLVSLVEPGDNYFRVRNGRRD
jgi:hypothetical protein